MEVCAFGSHVCADQNFLISLVEVKKSQHSLFGRHVSLNLLIFEIGLSGNCLLDRLHRFFLAVYYDSFA